MVKICRFSGTSKVNSFSFILVNLLKSVVMRGNLRKRKFCFIDSGTARVNKVKTVCAVTYSNTTASSDHDEEVKKWVDPKKIQLYSNNAIIYVGHYRHNLVLIPLSKMISA